MKFSKAPVKTLTIRLSPQLYKAVHDLAQERQQSLNAFLQESLTDAVKASEERARFEGYTLLGQDAECEVAYATTAQAEVMLLDEP